MHFLERAATTIICVAIGHVVTDEEIKRALKDNMVIVCNRCGISSSIKIDEKNHVRAGEPNKFFHGSDLGDKDNWKN